ncbi:hypothetical protein [Actinomadura violacea]|uniref:Uncharacterized protein n=1 Tax=Actinomadura violacea TaxID=2819934 RepID=A0ABS3RZI0_9ACTN|nr:hypothetical protein [Actinomadura violacea]MBO2461454.1 hypothetical protein [Actinomadura violacea]
MTNQPRSEDSIRSPRRRGRRLALASIVYASGCGVVSAWAVLQIGFAGLALAVAAFVLLAGTIGGQCLIVVLASGRRDEVCRLDRVADAVVVCLTAPPLLATLIRFLGVTPSDGWRMIFLRARLSRGFPEIVGEFTQGSLARPA